MLGKLIQVFDPQIWSSYICKELEQRQQIWDHLNMLDRVRQLREICGVPHKPEYTRVNCKKPPTRTI